MKISKLFHWLYAFIMLMPVFFIAGRVAYVTFNKNAKDSYSGANGYIYQYKYQTNEVNDLTDLVNGNIYTITINEFNNTTQDFLMFNCQSFYHLERNGGTYIGYERATGTNILNIRHTLGSSYQYFSVRQSGNYLFDINFNQLTFPLTFEFVYSSTTNGFTGFTYTITATPNERNILTGVEINNNGTLDNAFEYSVNQLNEVPIFSWAQTSFLVAPFSYITGLFGIASTSPVNTLLSYWLSISIIWLVFDLVMYLPLLIHRWLDKGVLE